MKIDIQIISDALAIKQSGFPWRHKSAGAMVEFYGIVREIEGGDPIEALVYEAYSEMAEKEMRRILAELQQSFPCEYVTIIHRIGRIPAGEPSIYVRAISSHRKEAFLMASTFMDRLKESVPIWKVDALKKIE